MNNDTMQYFKKQPSFDTMLKINNLINDKIKPNKTHIYI
jgi:hypothetical protein